VLIRLGTLWSARVQLLHSAAIDAYIERDLVSSRQASTA